MAMMNYVTPGITKIEFEDNIFAVAKLGKDFEQYIESRGGIVKSSVTKATNYLIYMDGEEETSKYEKALELVQEKSQEINILPLSVFNMLCKNKEFIEFGSYPFETDGLKRPIEWFVLKRDGKKALLLSAYGLDSKPYNEKWEEVIWETCTLRKWLNEDFYHASFSDEEKARILFTLIENVDNPNYHTPGGSDTEDKIFLLSIYEVKEYLTEEPERRTPSTPYAADQGAYNGNCWWWLRSPGDSACRAAGVGRGGSIDDSGNYVDLGGGSAVCPAMWVELE